MATVIIWDRFVRSYHWVIAVAFALDYFVLEPGGDNHQIVGYIAVGLVAIRIIWAFIGPENARIRSFWPTSERFKRHFQHLRQRRIPADEGHNAVGGLLIIFFWLLFLTQGVTGFLMEETNRFFGNASLRYIHALTADALFVGVLIHVSAVLIMGWWGRIQLIRPMITGKRRSRK
ncbi:cytochrome b/b6 domain-containing protein [Aliidiomarina sp. Khilg15.8]